MARIQSLEQELPYAPGVTQKKREWKEILGKIAGYFGYPMGYIKKRKWNLKGTNNISYKDINRWLHNIDLLRNSEFNPLVPSNTLKPSNTLIPSNKLI